MSDEQFTRLFNHMNGQFAEVKEELRSKASQDSLNSLTNTVDGFFKRMDTYEIEHASSSLRFDRLLNWAREVSRKTGIPLKDL